LAFLITLAFSLASSVQNVQFFNINGLICSEKCENGVKNWINDKIWPSEQKFR
jgi:hypothetical protein